jgi:hypothetical protein
MIEPIPQWIFIAQHQLTLWYGHVHLLPCHVLGQWFCVDRETSRPLWEHAISPANAVSGVTDGVIIASQTVSIGPGTWHEGCYGIALDTGLPLWALDADAPSLVHEGECVCSSGQIVAARDGRPLRRITPEQVREGELRRFNHHVSDAYAFYRTRIGGRHPKRVRINGVGWLTHRRVPNERVRDGFRLYAIGDPDEVIWSFDLATTGYSIGHCNYFSYRLEGRHVYVVASENPEPTAARSSGWGRLLPTTRKYPTPIPAVFHLLVLELSGGTVVQDIRFNDEPVEACRIEDVDDRSILVSVGSRELRCYRRVPHLVRQH